MGAGWFLWANGDLNWVLWPVVVHSDMFGARGVPTQCASVFLVLRKIRWPDEKNISSMRMPTYPPPAFQGAWGVYRVAVCSFLCTQGAICLFSHAHALACYARHKLVSVSMVCVCYYRRLYMPLLRLFHAHGAQREPLTRHSDLHSCSLQPIGHRHEHR